MNRISPLWINMSLFVASIIAISLLRKGAPAFIFFAGVFMSQYFSSAGAVSIEIVKNLMGNGLSLSRLEPSRPLRIFILIGSSVIAIIAFIVWIACWVGTPGLWFGAGTALGSLAFSFGIGEALNARLNLCRV